MRTLVFGLAIAALLCAARPASANLITNGSFETGTFAGWTQFGNTGLSGVSTSPPLPFTAPDGGYQAFFGPNTPGGIWSNHFATTAGKTYYISFMLAIAGGGTNSFSLKF